MLKLHLHFLFLTLHEITICYIYILHVLKHNALSLYLTSSKLKNIIKVKISTPKFIHYRTNSKHAFYFNKTNTIKTKKIIKISNSKYKIYFCFFKIKKNFQLHFIILGEFYFAHFTPIYVPFHFQKFSIFLGTLDFAHFTPFQERLFVSEKNVRFFTTLKFHTLPH